MNEQVRVKNLKKTPKSWLSLIGVFLILSCVLANSDMQTGIQLHVRTAKGGQFGKYRNDSINKDSYFISGEQGDLWITPANLIDALMLEMASGKGLDVFHILLLCIYVGVFYFMLSQSDSTTFFTKRTIYGVYILAVLISATGGFELLRYFIANIYIRSKTNGQFNLMMPDIQQTYFYALGTFFMIFGGVLQRGIDLQRDQELTI